MTKETREKYSIGEYLDEKVEEGYFNKPENNYLSLAEAFKGKGSGILRKISSRLPFIGFHICRSTLEKELRYNSRALVRTKSTKNLAKFIRDYVSAYGDEVLYTPLVKDEQETLDVSDVGTEHREYDVTMHSLPPKVKRSPFAKKIL